MSATCATPATHVFALSSPRMVESKLSMSKDIVDTVKNGWQDNIYSVADTTDSSHSLKSVTHSRQHAAFC